jgi:hypothetical protein
MHTTDSEAATVRLALSITAIMTHQSNAQKSTELHVKTLTAYAVALLPALYGVATELEPSSLMS